MWSYFVRSACASRDMKGRLSVVGRGGATSVRGVVEREGVWWGMKEEGGRRWMGKECRVWQDVEGRDRYIMGHLKRCG